VIVTNLLYFIMENPSPEPEVIVKVISVLDSLLAILPDPFAAPAEFKRQQKEFDRIMGSNWK
jgi:hypothetical protein